MKWGPPQRSQSTISDDTTGRKATFWALHSDSVQTESVDSVHGAVDVHIAAVAVVAADNAVHIAVDIERVDGDEVAPSESAENAVNCCFADDERDGQNAIRFEIADVENADVDVVDAENVDVDAAEAVDAVNAEIVDGTKRAAPDHVVVLPSPSNVHRIQIALESVHYSNYRPQRVPDTTK